MYDKAEGRVGHLPASEGDSHSVDSTQVGEERDLDQPGGENSGGDLGLRGALHTRHD